MNSTTTKNETITGTVTIKTFKDGECKDPPATTQDITGGKATIDPATKTEGPKLTITGITDASALENTTGNPECSVSVDTNSNKLTIKYKDTTGEKCIEITLTGSDSITKTATPVKYGHILTECFDMSKVHPAVVSPSLMIIVVTGLLVMTIFPPVIVAALRRATNFGDPRSPMCKWNAEGFYGAGSGLHWHAFELLMIIKISLAYLCIYSTL